jgi:hypothetical protein
LTISLRLSRLDASGFSWRLVNSQASEDLATRRRRSWLRWRDRTTHQKPQGTACMRFHAGKRCPVTEVNLPKCRPGLSFSPETRLVALAVLALILTPTSPAQPPLQQIWLRHERDTPSARLQGQARIPRRYPQAVALRPPLQIGGPLSSQVVGRRIVPPRCEARPGKKSRGANDAAIFARV